MLQLIMSETFVWFLLTFHRPSILGTTWSILDTGHVERTKALLVLERRFYSNVNLVLSADIFTSILYIPCYSFANSRHMESVSYRIFVWRTICYKTLLFKIEVNHGMHILQKKRVFVLNLCF